MRVSGRFSIPASQPFPGVPLRPKTRMLIGIAGFFCCLACGAPPSDADTPTACMRDGSARKSWAVLRVCFQRRASRVLARGWASAGVSCGLAVPAAAVSASIAVLVPARRAPAPPSLPLLPLMFWLWRQAPWGIVPRRAANRRHLLQPRISWSACNC